MVILSIKYEKLHDKARKPVQATDGSAGFDLFAVKDIYIRPGEIVVVDTGLKFEIPEGYFMYVSSKSGLAVKHGIHVLNSPGLIDHDYRGELSVILHKVNNLQEIEGREDFGYQISRGDKIAQFVVLPYPKVILHEGVVNVNTQRGSGGFGSTGK